MEQINGNDFGTAGHRAKDSTFIPADNVLNSFCLELQRLVRHSDTPDTNNVEPWWIRLKMVELLNCTFEQSVAIFEHMLNVGMLKPGRGTTVDAFKVTRKAESILDRYNHQSQVPDELLEEWARAKGYHSNWARIYRIARGANQHAA